MIRNLGLLLWFVGRLDNVLERRMDILMFTVSNGRHFEQDYLETLNTRDALAEEQRLFLLNVGVCHYQILSTMAHLVLYSIRISPNEAFDSIDLFNYKILIWQHYFGGNLYNIEINRACRGDLTGWLNDAVLVGLIRQGQSRMDARLVNAS